MLFWEIPLKILRKCEYADLQIYLTLFSKIWMANLTFNKILALFNPGETSQFKTEIVNWPPILLRKC